MPPDWHSLVRVAFSFGSTSSRTWTSRPLANLTQQARAFERDLGFHQRVGIVPFHRKRCQQIPSFLRRQRNGLLWFFLGFFCRCFRAKLEPQKYVAPFQSIAPVEKKATPRRQVHERLQGGHREPNCEIRSTIHVQVMSSNITAKVISFDHNILWVDLAKICGRAYKPSRLRP